MPDDWPERIAARVRAAAAGGFRPFGAEQHGLRLRPPLPEEEIDAFERRYAVALPAEYRAFLARAGEGGAGPGYGMYSLREALTAERGEHVPDDILRTPFPRTRAYDPDGDDPELEPLWKRRENGEIDIRRLYLYESAGTLALCHEGCGYYHLLVVTGSARGQVWIDGRCSDYGIQPLGVGFREWYERWLDSTLAGGSGAWWLAAPTG